MIRGVCTFEKPVALSCVRVAEKLGGGDWRNCNRI